MEPERTDLLIMVFALLAVVAVCVGAWAVVSAGGAR